MKYKLGKKGKYCSKCDKAMEEHRIGKQRYCLSCHAENMRENRKDKYNMLNSEQKKKVIARKLVYAGVKKGDIVKCPCSVCGSDNVEAHHPDYDKPKNVIWVCRQHHLELHKTG